MSIDVGSLPLVNEDTLIDIYQIQGDLTFKVRNILINLQVQDVLAYTRL